jgi:hypothetical protein
LVAIGTGGVTRNENGGANYDGDVECAYRLVEVPSRLLSAWQNSHEQCL